MIDSQKNRTQFYRSDEGEITLVACNGFEAMSKNEDGTWNTSYDPEAEAKAIGRLKGNLTVDKDGNQTWTNDGRTVYRYADGSIKTERADGSYYYENATGTVKEHGHTGRSKIAKVIVRTDGSGELVYRDKKRLRRYPNRHLLASLDDQGNEQSTREGWFVVTDDAAVTELNADTKNATVYYRDGTTLHLERKVSESDGSVSYLDEDKRIVNLTCLHLAEHAYLGPIVGLARKGNEYSMLRGLDFLSEPTTTNRLVIAPRYRTRTTPVYVKLVRDAPLPAASPNRFVGSKWKLTEMLPSGTEQHTVVLLSGGQLKFTGGKLKFNGERKKHSWEPGDDGSLSIFVNNKYAIYTGKLDDANRLSGTATNKRGLKWNWSAVRIGNEDVASSSQTSVPIVKSKPTSEDFVTLDKDGNGELSDAELGGTRTGWLAFGDHDKSKGLSSREWEYVKEKSAFGEMLVRQNRVFVGQRFKKFDRNSDGVLKGDEVVPELAKKLAEIDANQDGVITLLEYLDVSAKWREQALRRAKIIP